MWNLKVKVFIKLKSQSFLQNLKVLFKLTGDAFSAAALSERLVLEEDVGGDGIGEDLKIFENLVSNSILANFNFDRWLADVLKTWKCSFSSTKKVCWQGFKDWDNSVSPNFENTFWLLKYKIKH